MKLKPFEPLKYSRIRDIPYFLWLALWSALHGRLRFAGRLVVLCWRTVLLALGLIALSGCTTTRYVTVPCISKDQELPAEPPKVHDKLTGKADEDLRTVGGSAIRLRAWGEGLQGILEGCRER